MLVYCVFQRMELNVHQCQYVLRGVFKDLDSTIEFIVTRPDRSMWSYEAHEIN